MLTLDALHDNPKTISLICEGENYYIIGLKGNQKRLLDEIKIQIQIHQNNPLFSTSTLDFGHGRIEQRAYALFSLKDLNISDSWNGNHPKSVIVVYRKNHNKADKKETESINFYITNMGLNEIDESVFKLISNCIRKHWTCETYHGILDGSFNEDMVKTKYGKFSVLFSYLRTFAVCIVNKMKLKNIREMMVKLQCQPDFFKKIILNT